MEKKKYPHTDPNDQVHSEYENSQGNNFDVVREESPVKKKKQENKEDAPLNELPPDEYAVKNEDDTEEEPPKMDTGKG
jgi:hypothetical protein